MKHDPDPRLLAVPAPEPGLPEHPSFATDAETEAYWRGVSSGLRMAAASNVTIVGGPPDDAAAGPRVRRARVDWDAANYRRRRRFADHLMDRSLKGQTEVIRGENGLLVGTRHRHDNRLAMAMLTRADRQAEAYREGERLTIAVSEEFEELLDIIEAEGNAMAFIESRRPVEREPYLPASRAPEGDEELLDFYYRARSPAEAHRLADRPFDCYPDAGRERERECGEG